MASTGAGVASTGAASTAGASAARGGRRLGGCWCGRHGRRLHGCRCGRHGRHLDGSRGRGHLDGSRGHLDGSRGRGHLDRSRGRSSRSRGNGRRLGRSGRNRRRLDGSGRSDRGRGGRSDRRRLDRRGRHGRHLDRGGCHRCGFDRRRGRSDRRRSNLGRHRRGRDGRRGRRGAGGNDRLVLREVLGGRLHPDLRVGAVVRHHASGLGLARARRRRDLGGPRLGAHGGALARDRAAAHVRGGVLRLPVHARLEVQVRAGAAAGAAHVADHLALPDLAALRHGEARHVRVARRELARVRDADDVPVAALLAGEADVAAGGRADRGARRRGEIDAVVVAAPARPEGRGLGALHGRGDRGRATVADTGDAARRRRGRRLGGLRRIRRGAGLAATRVTAVTGGRLARLRRRSGLARCAGRGVALRRPRGLNLLLELLPRLDEPALEALLDVGGHVVAAHGGAACLLLEEGSPCDRADHAVDLQAGACLVGAHGGVGLRSEHAVGGQAERPLDVGDQVAAAPEV